MADRRDPFGLLARRRSKVMFGSADVSGALRGGSYRASMDDRDSLTLRLDPTLLPPDPVDYLAPLVYVFRGTAGTGRSRDFVGHATTATQASDGLLDIEAFGMMLLTEGVLGYLAAEDVTAHELTYVMARSAGLTEAQISIPDLDELPVETFEVIAPIHGVAAREPTELADVTIVPADHALTVLGDMGFELAELEVADAFALSLQTERLGFDAERAGLDVIDLAIDKPARDEAGATDWPCCRTGPCSRLTATAVAPWSAAASWSRSADCRVSGAGPCSASAGLRAGHVELDPDDPLLGTLPHALTAADRLALAASPASGLGTGAASSGAGRYGRRSSTWSRGTECRGGSRRMTSPRSRRRSLNYPAGVARAGRAGDLGAQQPTADGAAGEPR